MHPVHLLKDYSLEITSKDVRRLEEVAHTFPMETRVSITFLPGDTVDELIGAAAGVRRLGLTPVPHISARRLRSELELERFLSGLQDRAKVDRVFVIAGDVPGPVGPYEDALAIIQSGLLTAHGISQVGIAGYPDGHARISITRLGAALADKLAALSKQGLGAEIVTQFVFDAQAVLDWTRQLRLAGIEAPIRIGVPGPARLRALLRFAARCGVAASTKIMAKYGASLANLLSTATPDRLVRQLAEGLATGSTGAVKLHLYSFGGVPETVRWAGTFTSSEQGV